MRPLPALASTTIKTNNVTCASYFDGLPLKAVVADEIQAYGAEKSFLEAQRPQLAARCFPWEGTLSYHSEIHMGQPEDSQTGEGTGTVHRETKIDRVVDAQFTLKEGITTARFTPSLDTSRDARASGTTKCRTAAFKYEERPFSSESHEEAHIKGSGQSKGSISVKFNGSTGSYDISFSCASLPGNYSGNKTSSRSGGCDPVSAKPTSVPIPTTPVDVDCVNDSVGGTVDPKATVIRDSKPLPLPGSTTVQWEFHRKAAPQN